jgi:hypothetical protein
MSEKMSTKHSLKIPKDDSFEKPLSLLEQLVIEDMKNHNIDYPYCSVDDVKNYWKERLQ